jgi:hypothetical protein
MRKRIGWFGLLVVGLLCAPASVRAQQDNYEVPPVDFTGPFSHPRIEDGGFYVYSDFLYWKTNRVIQSQEVAKRGFMDTDGTVTGQPGFFVGDGNPALNTNQVSGPGVFQPGWDLSAGWKFQGGVVVEINWKHLVEASYSASASIIPPTVANVGNGLEDTFLYSGVSNFPEQFAGTAQKIATGQPGAVYGIWNGASVMQEQLVQRFDIYQIIVRVPMYQSENYRNYGIFGPRIAWIWENYRWTTIDYDLLGNTSPATSARYDNMVSNRMYGVHFGCGNDWYWGSTPSGAFGFIADFEGGLYADLVKTHAAYTRLDNVISEARNRRLYSIAPGAETRLQLVWYPWEAIQIHLGFDLMAYFNTIASTQPIDFNMGTIDPQYSNILVRYFTGMSFGISFVF